MWYARVVRIPVSTAIILSLVLPWTAFAADSMNRRDGFLLIWNSISRPVIENREKPYADVKAGDPGFAEITYAKSRGLLDDEDDQFHPLSPLTPTAALTMIFRTRSVEPMNDEGVIDFMGIVEPENVPTLAAHYGIEYDSEGSSMTEAELLDLMRMVDAKLMTEEHEVSLYSEKFHGKGTAFGEIFDMNALTAAHRTYPANTLVKVTNKANGKSVVVRINDRGPFVQGRNMDLSLAAFTRIAERSAGKIQATFERLGDVNLVGKCKDQDYQRRVTRDVILDPGIPHTLALGENLRLSSKSPFVVRDVIYPDGTHTGIHTWVTDGETFDIDPSVAGVYRFIIGNKFGRVREMRMEVVDCTS